MNSKQWLSFLGLANRAGKIISGEELVVKSIQNKRARLVILSKDASARTTKKILDKCEFYQVPVRIAADRYTLGESIGKAARVVIAVIDEGFSNKLLTMLDSN